MEQQTQELLIKLLNLWFYKDDPQEENVSPSLLKFGNELIQMINYGEDAIYAHPKVNDMIWLLKDYGVIDYEKTTMELYYEGKMRVQLELKEMFDSPQVKEELAKLKNVLGDVFNNIKTNAEERMQQEKEFRATCPELKVFKHLN